MVEEYNDKYNKYSEYNEEYDDERLSLTDVYINYLYDMFNFKESYTPRNQYFIVIAIQAIILSITFCLSGAEFYFFGTSILGWSVAIIAGLTILANISLALHRLCDTGLSHTLALTLAIILSLIPIIGWLILLILCSFDSDKFSQTY